MVTERCSQAVEAWDLLFKGHLNVNGSPGLVSGWKVPERAAGDTSVAFVVSGDTRMVSSVSDAEVVGTSLVGIRHNSAEDEEHSSDECPECQRSKPLSARCPNASWVRGLCIAHVKVQYVRRACKARGCEVCGPHGRWLIAERIAYGVREIEAAGGSCAWLVLTFAEDISKKAAVVRLAKFVRWLRKRMSGLQYVATYELTKAGRLHINLIAGAWLYVGQRELQEQWGARVWIERVKDSGPVGTEAAKSYTPESLGGYLAKLEQAVPREWHRRVSYSKGWPKKPEEKTVRRGEIVWREPTEEELSVFLEAKEAGRIVEVRPDVFEFVSQQDSHADCDCFEHVAEEVPRETRAERRRRAREAKRG